LWAFAGDDMKETRHRFRLVVVVLLLGFALGRWNFGISDFEQINLIVLGKIVETRTNEVCAAVIDESDIGQVRQSPLPRRLRVCLRLVWRIRGVDLARVIPADRLDTVYAEREVQGHKYRGFERYRDKVSGQEARVYSVRSINWIGRNQVLVSWAGTHASLDGGGSTFRMRRILGLWWIVEDRGGWIS
jgi:hypothetical protein